MTPFPRISLVTPSFNQGRFIAQTVESVLAQNYPNLEYIIMDGGSSDDTLALLQNYAALPFVKIISEPDRGQADAINKGFQRASGEIFGFLNSDDLLFPGALERAAREITPQASRQVVMGRCKFITEDGQDTGLEHPSYFESYRRVLEVWRGHALPQPAIFFTRQAWQNAGEMRLDAFHFDYDFFCRLSRRYPFHFVDQVWAAYRLQAESKTMQWTHEQRLKDAISISRRYWGGWYTPRFWQLLLSLWRFHFQRARRGRALIKSARQKAQAGRYLAAVWNGALGSLLAPEVVFYAALFPLIKPYWPDWVWRPVLRPAFYSQSLAYRSWVRVGEDGWVGPELIVSLEGQGRVLILQGQADSTYLPAPLRLSLFINGILLGEKQITRQGEFEITLPLPAGLESPFDLRVTASEIFILHQFTRGEDYRPLSWKFQSLTLLP